MYLIVAVYIALSLLYIRFVPIFEAPDEQAHAQYVAYYTTSNHLPDTRAELSIAGPESTQGPLYYAVSGLLLRLLGAPALPLDRPRNPQFTSPDVNLFVPVRTPADDAIRLARLVSTAGGIAAILATYALARCLGTATQTALHGSLFVAQVMLAVPARKARPRGQNASARSSESKGSVPWHVRCDSDPTLP